MENPYPTPGLKSFRRANGKALYWVASEECVKAGYPVKTANLSALADDPLALSQRCQRMQAEMLAWKHNGVGAGALPEFDGTFGCLLDIYERDRESPFNERLKPNVRRTYGVYVRKLKGHIGTVHIDDTDGRQLKRWFALWADQENPNNPRSHYRKLGAGRMAVAVLKAAVSFGVMCRYQGCEQFQTVMAQVSFQSIAPRSHAPTREQMLSVGEAAILDGAPSRALAYAFQYETMLRQSDVIGEWVEFSDPRPSTVIYRGRKWIGLTWKQIDEHLVLRATHGKTEGTSEARSAFDLKLCPMVMDHLQHFPAHLRVGPVIVDEATGFPYLYPHWRKGWKADYAAAGLPPGMWNRDTRAGGNTEAQMKGAPMDDRKMVIGHTAGSRTTAKVYDRDTLEAHRRVAKARAKDE